MGMLCSPIHLKAHHPGNAVNSDVMILTRSCMTLHFFSSLFFFLRPEIWPLNMTKLPDDFRPMMRRCLCLWFGICCCLCLCCPAFAFSFALSFGCASVSMHADCQETLAFTTVVFAFALACAFVLDK